MMTNVEQQVTALLDEVERLRKVVEAARRMRGRLIGHEGHFDYTMRRGAGCELCIGQREVAAEFDAALSACDVADAAGL